MDKTTKKVVDEVVQKPKRKRPDRSEALKVHTEPGDNAKYISHSLSLVALPKVDMSKPEEVNERVAKYFELCGEHDMKPSVAGMALAFDCDRSTLWKWVNGIDCAYLPAESRHAVKKGYQLLNAQMEDYMQNGKINPVSGIFLMKNNMGYADKQEVVVTPNNSLGESASAEDLQTKYLEDTHIDYEE